ncbi:MAG: endolytic transglycosylase MltG [Myxococcales bacterium]|nr:endolytic transglycosylase MltG [Myxococcales bacterium]
MKKKVLIALGTLALLLVLVALGLYLWAKNYASTPALGSGATVAVDIPAGSGPRRVAALLAEKKVIDDPDSFYYYLRFFRREAGNLKSGELAFRDNMTPDEVIQVLLDGTPITHRITVPEGLRLDEVAKVFADAELADAQAFEQHARDKEFCASLGVPAPSLEGFLLPETYAFRKHTPVDEILKTMLAENRKVFTPEVRQRAKEMGLSELEVLTLASIVEKETGDARERPLIAAVFHNRLKQGWKLQTDPSVIYAKILATGKVETTIYRSDLERDHPYNTYRYPGLPPGPICNPGAAAIRAVLWPDQTEYMFFVSKNNGTHEFCKDLACHNRAVNLYQRKGQP